MTLPYPIDNKFGETVEPSGDILERIAAAIYAAKPGNYKLVDHYERRLTDPVGLFLFNTSGKEREGFAKEWANNLLSAFDNVGIDISDRMKDE